MSGQRERTADVDTRKLSVFSVLLQNRRSYDLKFMTFEAGHEGVAVGLSFNEANEQCEKQLVGARHADAAVAPRLHLPHRVLEQEAL